MIRTIQWLNANRYRRYPIVENAPISFSGTAGEFTLPSELLLDVQITDYYRRAGMITLYSVTVETNQIAVVFGYAPEGADPEPIHTLYIPKNGTWPYRMVQNTAERTIQATFGRGVEFFNAQPNGVYYAVGLTQIEPSLIIYQGRHRVESIVGDSPTSVPISGDIYWEEGYSVRISIQQLSNSVILVPVPGAGAGYSCERTMPDRAAYNNMLLLVNGVPGDAAGNIQLAGRRGIAVEPVTDKHEIRVRVNVDPFDITCKGNSK